MTKVSKLKFKNEEEVANVTSILFKHWNYDLYPEVDIDIFQGRPDFVGLKGKSVCAVIECKLKLSHDVLAQVCRWHMEKDYYQKDSWYKENPYPARQAVPNYLWVATSDSRSGKMCDIKEYLLCKFGIGWIDFKVVDEVPENRTPEDWWSPRGYKPDSVDKYSDEDYGYIFHGNRRYEYRVVRSPRIQEGSRRTSHYIIDRLLPEMKQATAGTTGGKTNYITPFKITLMRCEEILKESDKPLSPADLCEKIREKGGHHYSKDTTFKQSIGGWLVQKDIAEKVEDRGRVFYKLKGKV